MKTNSLLAQAYGTDTYNNSTYSCATTDTACIEATQNGTTTTTTETAPNTGFFGLSQDAALATMAGAMLVALAIVGVVFVIVGRVKARKNKAEA